MTVRQTPAMLWVVDASASVIGSTVVTVPMTTDVTALLEVLMKPLEYVIELAEIPLMASSRA
jgi:hypothetical protein